MAHNELRALHGSPMLTWSADLASDAKAWASACWFSHSGMAWGENIAMGGSNPASLTRYWYTREVCDMDWAYQDVGSALHMTQLVWARTTSVGCAMVSRAECPDGIRSPLFSGAKQLSMLVCMYYPAGNTPGQFEVNVARPATPVVKCP
eukprot:91993-Chlamydomonas_euryale.AAC.7